MNIFNRLTVKSLKKNKMRTFVTIIGIILSTALICAVTTSFASARQYAIDFMEFSNGKYDAMETNVDKETYEVIAGSDLIKDKGVLSYIGYAEINSCNDYKPYLYISGFEEDTEGLIPVHIISGRMPQNRSEIILPKHLSENGNVNYKEGDTIKLEIGDRKIDLDKATEKGIVLEDEFFDPTTNNEAILMQYNPFTAVDDKNGNADPAEYIDIREKREYTVVGIYERPIFEDISAPGYTALTVPDEYTEDMQYDVYYSMTNAKNIYEFKNNNALEGPTNTNLLLFKGVSKYKNYYAVIFGLVAIVIGLIMFGSVMLIYNAFAISVSERTKQFGLLSSIGGTRKQILSMVRSEATILSIIGIPLGIFLGIAGMWITFLAIGSKFLLFTSSDTFKEPMRICVSPAALIAAVVIAFVTIRISAWIPSKRAANISAVEAIRQNADIKESRYIGTPKYIYKLFGLPGLLAHKNFKRSKKKYRATIISLFMSVVLFISASAFTFYLTGGANDAFYTYGFDYVLYWNDSEDKEHDSDEILDMIKKTEYITSASYSSHNYKDVYISDEDINPQTLEKYPNMFMSSSKYDPEREGYKMIETNLFFIDDSTFIDYIRQNGLSEEDYYNKDAPLGIAFDNSLVFDSDKGRMIRFKSFNKDSFSLSTYVYNKIDGYPYITRRDDKVIYYKSSDNENDVIELSYNESVHELELNVGKVMFEKPYFIDDDYNSIIYPNSFKEDMIGSFNEYSDVEYKILSDDDNRGYEAILNTLKENKVDHEYFYNYAKFAEEDRNSVIIVKVFAYGFIVLISLIAVANVFNTITTNINLRRREFAMLKSVGMTDRDMKKMLNYECILYGTKALIYGIPVSAVVTYLIYRSINRGIDTAFSMPWRAICIAVLSVFIVVFSTMMYSMRKIKKDNPIDALKNENL